MRPEGDERPPDPPEDEGPEQAGAEPEYTVYGSDGERKGRRDAPGNREDPPAAEPGEGEGEGPGASEPPAYKVYRSRPSLRDRIGKPDIDKLRRQRPGGGGGGGLRERFLNSGGGWRRWLRWAAIAIGAWILISFLAFAISAQIQKGQLDDSAKDALDGGPALLAGQNILILGGDRRGDRQENASGTEGQGPPRADTIMVLHASLTSFRKLSIPRDAYASIPDCGEQKINASLACNTNSPDGNPGSTIRTVEAFLGIPIHHIVIIDFDGFADFINTLGGITVDIPENDSIGKGFVVCGEVDGGKKQGGVTIKLKPGEVTLEGDQALGLARIRKNNCDPSEDDTDRAARQQLILNGIKGRLTDPLRIPYNFIKGPWIGWNAPKAIISDMGGFTLPQLAISAVFGGSGETNVLEPSGLGPGGSLFISQGECRRSVEKLVGGAPDEDPECSPD